MSNRWWLILGLVSWSAMIQAQHYSLTLNGYVEDEHAQLPLEYVSVFIKEIAQGAVTDSTGYFEIKNLSPGTYHVQLSHVGCESKMLHVDIVSDTTLALVMDHSGHQLHEVVIKSESKQYGTQTNESISKQEIEDNAADNLSSMLENIIGVSSIKNGSGIAKPVVQGLYGSRLMILNNGVAQSGQQWGNDHSPEIDPLIANKISVIKGTAALEYLGGSLGAIVNVTPKKIGVEPHLHGSANYFFESNGRSHGLNVQMQKYSPILAWKINGSYKRSGDNKTPQYFLNNTGSQEANLALQLEKSYNDKWFVDLYASTFNTVLGVLRGSHIGNVTDLENALSRETPFFTENSFSYEIEAPRQKVNHHLGKLHVKRLFNDNEFLDFTLATQFNDRKEFDVRRGGRSNRPALSLQQLTLSLDMKYQKTLQKDWTVKSGVQYNFINNTNNSETGILPLIPNYDTNEGGLYVLMTKQFQNSFFDIGIRYDHMQQQVAAISTTLPRMIVRYDNAYNNVNASMGYTKTLMKKHKVTANVGYAMRNPGINELYSAGLHQGVSGIEEGDINLGTEKAFKATLNYSANIRSWLTFETLIYNQRINNYIFLKPQDEIRLTIRGAFPVFRYEQTEAEIYGVDVSSRLTFSENIYSDIEYSFIKGKDRSNDIPLINVPANNARATLVYQVKKPVSIGKYALSNIEFKANNRYVFRQNNLLPSQDYVLPPEGYNLVGLKISSDLQLTKTNLRFILRVDNLFNIKYRDYLNRQRYFADDLGRNFVFGVNAKF